MDFKNSIPCIFEVTVTPEGFQKIKIDDSLDGISE